MFLTYPLVIATSTLLGGMVWNYGALEKLQIFGLPARDILIVLVGFLVVCGVYEFYAFLHAYMRDDMGGRVLACWRFLAVFGVIPLFFATLPVDLSLETGLRELGAPSQLYPFIGGPIIFSASSLWFLLISRMCLRLLGWFEQYVPARFASSRHSDRFYVQGSYTFLIGAKVGFGACSVMSSVVTALLLVRDGLSQAAFGNLLTLICVTAIGVVVWVERG
jgi:hypothetical protein